MNFFILRVTTRYPFTNELDSKYNTYIEPMLNDVRRTPEKEDAASHDEREEERGGESPYNNNAG